MFKRMFESTSVTSHPWKMEIPRKSMVSLSVLVVALLACPVVAHSQGQPGSTEYRTPIGKSTTGQVVHSTKQIPSDQTPTSGQNADPGCGIAAETDATGSGKIPCNPSDVIPGTHVGNGK